MSEAGVMSRRAAEEEIERGNVTVNGVRAVLGQKIDDEVDVVEYRGKRIGTAAKKHVYVMLNKPVGYVTTMSDEQGRACVAELVEDVGTRVYPIGRLDKESEGLLLFTNDGELANRLMHPRYHKPKIYHVKVRGKIDVEKLRTLSRPMKIDDYTTKPVNISIVTMKEDYTVEMLGVEFQCVDEGFRENEPVDIVVRPEDVMIVGEDVEDADSELIEQLVQSKLPDDVELAVVKGDQPVYYYIISVE